MTKTTKIFPFYRKHSTHNVVINTTDVATSHKVELAEADPGIKGQKLRTKVDSNACSRCKFH